MLVNAFIYIAVSKQKWIVFLKSESPDEDKDALLKLKIKKRDLLEYSVSLKTYFFELCLKILRMLVPLSVFGVSFQKVGTI